VTLPTIVLAPTAIPSIPLRPPDSGQPFPNAIFHQVPAAMKT
jgi:hypothetical protein